jgi:hypothetical protein
MEAPTNELPDLWRTHENTLLGIDFHTAVFGDRCPVVALEDLVNPEIAKLIAELPLYAQLSLSHPGEESCYLRVHERFEWWCSITFQEKCNHGECHSIPPYAHCGGATAEEALAGAFEIVRKWRELDR